MGGSRSRDGPGAAIVSPGTGLPAVLACAGVVGVICATAVVGLNSPIIDRPALFVTLRIVGCLGLVALALVSLARGSGGRLAALLLAMAFFLALTGLTGSSVPGVFVIGRITIPLSILLVMYFCLAHPDGHIGDRASFVLLTLAAAGFTALLAANLLVSRVPPVAGPFVRCSGAGCPANPLNVVELPGAGRALSTALALWTTVTLAAAAILIARRVGTATRLQRRSLAPQLVWAVLVAVGYAFFIAVRAVNDHARLLTPAAVIIAALIAALPFAIALGMARGRVLAMIGLEHMIAGLGEDLSHPELQRAMSRALGDPTLKLLVWRASLERYVDIDGHAVGSLATSPGRRITRFSRDGTNLAAVVHDPALSDERDVLEAAGSAVGLALDNARLNEDLGASIGELEASRKRLASAADQERRRIEQDLHDGAQQGLIALRIKLRLLEELAAEEPRSVAASLADVGKHVDATLDQIRNLAKGIYPSALLDLGIAPALSAVARDLPITVALHADLRRRLPPDVEAAVYFCCVEALQNVAKHCGARARVDVNLSDRPDGLRFVVADDGPGFDPALITSTHGITGMRDRLAAVGGTLSITSTHGRGTTVTGSVPAAVL
jgi:signal transduction histidine kinase